LNINKEILRLAVPNILSNISIPLLSTVDTALMGHLSVDHLGAVGISAMIFNFIYWNFGFLRMGTTGMTAQYFGAGKTVEINLILIRSLFISLIISGLLLILFIPLSTLSIELMNVIPHQQGLVLEYFGIRILAAPATLGLYVILGWYFGMQNAIFPLLITVLINLLNLGLSFYLVVGLGWGIAGVAYGTVIAQYAGFFLSLILLYTRYRAYLYIRLDIVKGKLSDWSKLISVNANLFIRTACLTFAFAFFYAQSSKEGVIVLATNVVLLQFLNWMSYGIDGFAFASESLVGKYYGARNSSGMNRAISISFVWGFILAVSYAFIFYVFGDFIIDIFTADSEVKKSTSSYLAWVAILPVISFVCYIWDGVFIGLTAAGLMMKSMVISLILYLAYYYLSGLLGHPSIWYALLIFLLARGIILTYYWFFDKRMIFLKSFDKQSIIH